MKKCNSCNIKYRINDKYCPLCQNILVGASEEIMFPKNIRHKTNSLILKLLLFCSIVIVLLTGFFELVCNDTLHYVYYTGLALLTNYIVIYGILRYYQNIYLMCSKHGLIIIILLLVWYYVIKSPIITNYIIPSVCLLELIFNVVMGIILSKNYLIKYSNIILVNLFLLLVPMVLVWLKLTTSNMMAYICCLMSLISISGLLIFFFDDIKEELSKILHF